MKVLNLLLVTLTLSSLTTLAGGGKWLTDFDEARKIAAKENKELARKYSVTGFPTVLLTDAAGKAFGRTGYREGGVKPYLKHLNMLCDQKDME